MKNSIQKRGQRFLRKFSRASVKAGEEGKEHIKENLVKRFSHIANVRLLILEWCLLVGALILFAITQAFWFGSSYAVNVFSDGGTYTEATLGSVSSLNPLFATTNSEKVLSKLMFATLSTIDYSGHAGIGLAKSIRPSEDGKVWTVKLRDDLKWSDGTPLTSDDVIFTTELIKNPLVNSTFSSNLAKVKVEKNEEDAIIFTLPSSYADFITALNFPIVPKHILENTEPQNLVENSFSTAPVTSGAFSFNAVQSSGSTEEKVFYLSANPYYYKGRPLLNSFAVHTYGTKDEIIQAVNSGSVTATAELSGKETEQVKASNFIMKNSSLNYGAFIFFNMSSATTKNLELRSAIRQGINIDKIRAAAPETQALDYPLLKSQIKLSRYPELPERNVEAAKNKIKELSPDSKLKINLVTVNSGYLPQVSEVLKEELENLGCEVDLTTYEENQEFISNVIAKRSYDILVYDIELGTDPDLLPYFHSSQASSTGLNLSNYRNLMVDDLILGARDALDDDLRAKKYETLLDYWVASVPAIGLYQPNLTYYYNKNVRTFGNNVRLVTAIDRFSDIDMWAVSKTAKNKTP
ncbi:hypothetical protein IKF28_01470 [Candidatus Saccharibacteria bacterium]|nr:hypothetical protein [Candidatus Saccharibacteria bacterium]